MKSFVIKGCISLVYGRIQSIRFQTLLLNFLHLIQTLCRLEEGGGGGGRTSLDPCYFLQGFQVTLIAMMAMPHIIFHIFYQIMV